MKTTLCLLAAVLPLMAQPKLLVNAKVDTKSAASGLEGAYKALLSAQPQPAWIGWEVPSVPSTSLGCEFVRDGYASAGVIHLEPPDHAVILFRVEGNRMDKLRTLSPFCEIDAGGLPMHWLTDVSPAQSVALLSTLVPQRELERNGAVTAISIHADASADPVMDKLVAPNQPDWLRKETASLIGSRRGKHGVDVLKGLIANDQSLVVKQAAINALANSKEPEALTLLTATARNDKDPKLRSQAIGTLARKPGQPVIDTINNAIATDPDPSVRRRAVDTLGNLPDDGGVPALIQLVKTSKDPDVRKQAMNKLQNSHDLRAIAYFEEVLK